MNSYKYDIAVLGFWYGVNYGSLLNGFATYKLLKNMGKKVLMVQKPGSNMEDPEIKSGHNVRFYNKYYDKGDISKLYSFDSLKDLNNLCSTFCVGSDQTWHYKMSFNENLYLPFVETGKKKITFSTSFGHKFIYFPPGAKERVKSYISSFDAISLREKFSVRLLKREFGISAASLVIDPTLCIDTKYYDEIERDSDWNEKDYVLAYILNPSISKLKLLKKISKKIEKKIITIADGNLIFPRAAWVRNKEIGKLFPNVKKNIEVSDFLKAYRNASYVVTDSFHGTIFSIIYKKQFISLSNFRRGAARFSDLLGRLHLSNRLISSIFWLRYLSKCPKVAFLLHQKINYDKVAVYIDKEKLYTIDWLKSALEK